MVYKYIFLNIIFCITASLVHAQSYPIKPLRMVVGFAPGGAPDIFARLLAQPLNDKLGQPVVVDNRPGATSNIGAEIVARAAPDGYTLFMATVSITISPSVYRSLAFRMPEDFAPVSMVASVPLIVVVHPGLPVKSIQDLIRVAKERAGQLNYASVGTGSPQHLAVELFKLKTGTQLLHVPYKGGAPANTAVLSGESHVYFSGMPPALPHVRAGRLRALAVTSDKRSPAAADVPTVSEAGLKGSEADNWHAVLAPAKTSASIVQRLNSVLAMALADTAIQTQFVNQGAEVRSGTPQGLARHMQEEIAKWGAVAKAAGVKVQ
ncbi:MAG: tripartite tricarboxylate transporter substrate binding protein [Burkholderiales bacterium]